MFNIIFNKKRVSACLSLKKQHCFQACPCRLKSNYCKPFFLKEKITNFLQKKVRETEENRQK